jgi:membrane associated rhomboid family serine protease
MVMPLADDNSDRRTFPYVNIALIAINVLVFIFFQGFGNNDFTLAWMTRPWEIVSGREDPTPLDNTDPDTGQVHQVLVHKSVVQIYLTLLVSMFMHGGLAHIAGNMWFLWIFGDNVEDAMGHLRYVIFYLVCGLIASLSHVFITVLLFGMDSQQAHIPSLGASGAISGVLGGYLILFPQKRVLVILVRIVTQVPAIVAIGMWFLFQIISSLPMLGGRGSDGVAYAAHIGGFVAGMGLVKFFAGATGPSEWLPAPRPTEPDERW